MDELRRAAAEVAANRDFGQFSAWLLLRQRRQPLLFAIRTAIAGAANKGSPIRRAHLQLRVHICKMSAPLALAVPRPFDSRRTKSEPCKSPGKHSTGNITNLRWRTSWPTSIVSKQSPALTRNQRSTTTVTATWHDAWLALGNDSNRVLKSSQWSRIALAKFLAGRKSCSE